MPNIGTRRCAQARLNVSRKTKRIPSAHDAGSLCITDGLVTAGFVLHHNDSWWAFTPDGTLFGEYSSKVEAIRSLPAADYCGVADVGGRP